MFARILVPSDGSTAASQALQEAICLARGHKTTIRLLHVVERLRLDQGLEPVVAIAEIIRMMEAGGKRLLQSAGAMVQAA